MPTPRPETGACVMPVQVDWMAVLLAAFFLFDIIATVLIVLYVSKRRQSAVAEQVHKPAKRGSLVGGIALLVVSLFWSSGVLLFDVLVAQGIVNQSRTQFYVTCEGKVLHCAVKEVSDSDG